MALITTDVVVLRCYAMGEGDRIVVFLTADRGKKRGVARHAGQSRRRFGAGLEPLTVGRMTFREREGRDLAFIEDMAPVRSPLQRAVVCEDALGCLSYVAELIDEWAPDNDPNEPLFRLVRAVMDAFVAGVAIGPLTRYFEYWLLRLQGVYAVPDGASAGARAFLEQARACGPQALATVTVPTSVLDELTVAHRRLMAHYLDKDMKSARVWREMQR